MTFNCQNTYILLSISTSIQKEADEQRIIKVYLKSSDKATHDWEETKKQLKEFNTEYYAGVLQRASKLVRKFKESYEMIKKVFVEKVKTENNSGIIMRLADTYSTPLAGYWHWTHDEVIDQMSADILIDEIKADDRLSNVKSDDNKCDTKEKLWDDFKSYHIRLPSGPTTIAQLIINGLSNELLEGYGIKRIDKYIFLQYKNRNLTNIFKDLKYMDYANILKQKEGVKYNVSQHICGKTHKGLMIPIDFDITKPAEDLRGFI
jgi:hypothetical protein